MEANIGKQKMLDTDSMAKEQLAAVKLRAKRCLELYELYHVSGLPYAATLAYDILRYAQGGLLEVKNDV